MNPLILQIVNNKLNTINEGELKSLAQQYQFSINDQQAKEIIRILRSETINVVDDKQRNRLLTKIKKQVDPQTARQFFKMLKQYEQYL